MAIIEIRNVRASTSVEDEGAVDVSLEYDGFTGEATLVRGHDDRLSAWGDPDMWLSARILSRLRGLEADAYRRELRLIEAACVAAAEVA